MKQFTRISQNFKSYIQYEREPSRKKQFTRMNTVGFPNLHLREEDLHCFLSYLYKCLEWCSHSGVHVECYGHS